MSFSAESGSLYQQWVSVFLPYRALEDHKRQMEENEKERRQAVLKERRREQDRARASFRQAVHPRAKAVAAAPDHRKTGSRVQYGKSVPTALDAKEIADMVAGKRQVSVPSLDEMLAQLRSDTPVATHEPPLVGRAEETCSATGSGVEGGDPLPAPSPGDMPETQLDTNTGPESPSNIYSKKNYASLARDSLEVEEDVRQSSPHILSSSQWADKVCLRDSLDGSSSGLHLSEPVLNISRELERVASSRPGTHSEANLLARLSSASGPQPPSNSGAQQPTSILKKSGQKAMLKQILSNAIEANSPSASQLADVKHVRFVDDPSLVCDADCEMDDLAAIFHAKASSGSSAHFQFSHGSEFAFRPLKNGLVPLPAGEKPLLETSHQSGGVVCLSAVPASSSQDKAASSSEGGTTQPPPAITACPPPQSSLTDKHDSDTNRRVYQDREGGVALNQTPTDDQISKLWSQMRGYLEENKALQETQRAGLQRLKQSTQLSWQQRQGWRATAQMERSDSRQRTVQTRRAAPPGSLRGGGSSPLHAPVQEWRGSRKGTVHAHPEEGVGYSPQAMYSQREPTDCAVPRDRRDTSECVHTYSIVPPHHGWAPWAVEWSCEWRGSQLAYLHCLEPSLLHRADPETAGAAVNGVN